MRIVFTDETLTYFNTLSKLLYEKEYFGFKEEAKHYVYDLLERIKTTLPTRVKKPAPAYFDRYGKKMLYAVFPKNKTTQWYVFFNVYQMADETVFLVRHISNNHVVAHYFR